MLFTTLHQYPVQHFHRKRLLLPFKPGKAMRTVPLWCRLLIIVAGCLFFFSSHVSAESCHLKKCKSNKISPDTLIDQIRAIYIYEVHNGHPQQQVFTGNDLKTCKNIQVNGYITGIVLFATGQMTVSVADQRMDVIQINRDGTLELKHFGRLKHRELLTTFTDSENPVDDLSDLKQIAGRYCCFPKIRGDAVCKQAFFDITLSGNNVTLTLPVSQTGSRKFHHSDLVGMESPDGLVFQDIGNSLSPSNIVSPEFKQRIAALSKGIEAVESGFQTKLVDTFNILNCKGLGNAYTYKGESEIWIYNQTLWEVSVQELRSLAEHEACHVLVDRAGLTQNSALRKHYADLKGYGDFSRERFMLLTYGAVQEADSKGNSPKSPFFAFINEKNFIQGMTGGHSQDNIDEFCASFLHSMLYIDRLQNNLKHPITLYDDKVRLLTKGEKRKILNMYQHTAELITAAAQKNSDAVSLSRFLETIKPQLRRGPAFGMTASPNAAAETHGQSSLPQDDS